jgi:selenocysteine lyase/cysteine desulfurase
MPINVQEIGCNFYAVTVDKLYGPSGSGAIYARQGNPPILMGVDRRIYAAAFNFWAGVIPPMPMFGRSLL